MWLGKRTDLLFGSLTDSPIKPQLSSLNKIVRVHLLPYMLLAFFKCWLFMENEWLQLLPLYMNL
ncbi:hypothetical protein OUZ56_017645 [Daphnia magna]|uniref:Uncharacterized protein n=1 Tax=Daphnia magna TaxID=35525 RepID=A0ABR0ATC2_9CRUS|nr:hypothetical protein OUZ56_017645 [Daphnia magna]